MTTDWNEAEDFLFEEAMRDLDHGAHARPCMLAFRGDEPIFCAYLRDLRSDETDWRQPVFELTVLAAGMSVDRVAISFSGRATSLADPIPPVTDGVDLRQQVVVVQRIDGHGQRAAGVSVVAGYERTSDGVVFGERYEMAEDQGWITQLIVTAVATRHHLSASREEIAEQVSLCALRGHTIAFGQRTVQRFGLDGAAAATARE